ncbi:Novel plant SNARE 11 [Linum perenne]
MDDLSHISEEIAEIDGQISDIFRALSNGFQKLEKVKDASRRSRHLEELTDKMRECKRLIKEFDKEVKNLESRNDAMTNRTLNEKKQSMIKELNSYVALKKQHRYAVDHKRVDLFDGPGEGFHDDNVMLASLMMFLTFSLINRVKKCFNLYVSAMTNEQLMDQGHHMMDETDQALERGKKIVQETIDVGTETAASLKTQTEQMSRVVNELDSIHFSMKRASKLVKEIGRQFATDKAIMSMLFLIVLGIITIIIVKIMDPTNKDIQDIPGLAPPAMTRKLLLSQR